MGRTLSPTRDTVPYSYHGDLLQLFPPGKAPALLSCPPNDAFYQLPPNQATDPCPVPFFLSWDTACPPSFAHYEEPSSSEGRKKEHSWAGGKGALMVSSLTPPCSSLLPTSSPRQHIGCPVLQALTTAMCPEWVTAPETEQHSTAAPHPFQAQQQQQLHSPNTLQDGGVNGGRHPEGMPPPLKVEDGGRGWGTVGIWQWEGMWGTGAPGSQVLRFCICF